MKLSAIIPAHNEEEFISKCLDSLIKQTYSDYEIIVVNDGSTDNTEDIVKGFQKKDSKIKLISFKKGHSAAFGRNQAVKMATGQVVIFIDADQFVETNFLFRIANNFKNKFKEKEIDALIGKVLGASKTFIGKCYNARKWLFWLTRQKKKKIFTQENPGCILAIKRELYHEMGGFDEKLFYREDTYFEQKAKKDYTVLFVPDLYIYHYDPNSWKEMVRHARWVGKGLGTDIKKSGLKVAAKPLLEVLFWPIYLILIILSIFIWQLTFLLVVVLFPLWYAVKTWVYSKDFVHSWGFLILSIPKNIISTYSFIRFMLEKKK